MSELSQKMSIRILLRETYKYFFQNWINLFILYGILFLIVKSISLIMEVLLARPGEGATVAAITLVPTLIFEIFCFPFVVWNKKIPSLRHVRTHSKENRQGASKALGWMVMRGLGMVIGTVGGGLVLTEGLIILSSVEGPMFLWILIPVLCLWLLLAYVVYVRTSLVGVILACDDASRGWTALWSSWKVLKGETFKVGLSFLLVFSSALIIAFLFGIGLFFLFEIEDKGVVSLSGRIFEFLMEGFLSMIILPPLMIFVGIVYRVKREATMALLSAIQNRDC